MEISFPFVGMILTALGPAGYVLIAGLILFVAAIFGIYTFNQLKLMIDGSEIKLKNISLIGIFAFLLLVWVIFSVSAVSAMIAYKPVIAVNPNSNYKRETNRDKVVPKETKPYIERDHIKVPDNRKEWEEYKRKFDKDYKEGR